MSLTNGDLVAIKDLMKATMSEDKTLVRKSDISHFLTKDEFYEEMGEVRKHLDGIHEELTILNHRTANHEDRLTDIEGKLKIKPSFA